MKYSSKKGIEVPVFSLGTVQLGMDYGLGEYSAKPEKEYAFSLLDYAVEKGITMLDTANNYGASESVIGEWLKTVKPGKRPMIVTKIDTFDNSSAESLENDIFAQVEKSLETLGLEQIDILMLHNYSDYEENPTVIKGVLEELKRLGKIRYTGISLYSSDDYFAVAKAGFDAVQIPLNLFDWRQIDSGGIKALSDAGMVIFTRSVFLQGLVFMEPEKLDKRMDFCIPYLRRFNAFCDEFNLSPGALAMSFALTVPGVDSLVLGCQRVEQLVSNCEMLEKARRLTEAEMNKIHEAFRDIDPRVTDPRRWFNSF